MSHDSKEVRQRLAQLHNNFVSKDLSEGIRRQVFFATFVQKVETQIKSTSVINALKQAFSQNMSHL